ncbi:hypothetical protein JTB14_035748 [Gonioctena quinquepunctata]|nr:hypothetical protein JTB14_035748 [Gonioctena quinquepunctata]
MAVVVATGSKLLKQQPGIISIAYVRSNNYSTDDRAYNLASLKRGTGGRSSFNGLVATVFGATGFMGRYVCNRLGKIGTQLIIPLQRLARAAKQRGVERFIHLSALNASENPGTAGILKGGSKFLASKARGEEAVLEEFPEATIFRPADVYGQEDRFVRYYAHTWRRQGQYFPLWHKGEKTEKQPVFIGDVATGIMNAIKDPDTAGKVYQAVG